MAEIWRSIASIEVESLFGKYNFPKIAFAKGTPESRLALIYGLNGSGKTTILNAIFNVLSPTPNRGHRSALARIPLRRFRIVFNTGEWVQIVRSEPVVGSYRYVFNTRDDKAEYAVIADENNAVTDGQTPEILQLHEALSRLNLSIVFLTADRLVLTSQAKRTSQRRHTYSSAAAWSNSEFHLAPNLLVDEGWQDSDERRRALFLSIQKANLSSLLEAADELIRQLAFGGRTSGDERTADVYSRIIQEISNWEEKPDPHDFDELLTKTKHLEEDAKRFRKMGLVAELRLLELSKSLASASQPSRAAIAPIIRPYLDSISQRLEALRPTLVLMESFQEALNVFLVRKVARVSAREGIRIEDNERRRIATDDLSSGEKQLLFLFATTLLARRGSSLILVDEPELSLNPAWQRQLMARLLDIAVGSPVQLVAATHSIEILSQHRDVVAELEI